MKREQTLPEADLPGKETLQLQKGGGGGGGGEGDEDGEGDERA